MSISLFEASVPAFITMMRGVSHCLNKGEAFAKENNIDECDFTAKQLAPDMLPLKSQIYILTDLAKGCVSRLAGKELPIWEDNESRFDELQARLKKCENYIASFDPDSINAGEERNIHLKLRNFELNFKGRDYLISFLLPNFYFHVTTSYNILRHQGVPLGKADFFGQ